MAVPLLNENGLLPAGVHDCTLGEIRKRFGSFNVTDRRVALFEKFERFVAETRQTGRVKAIIVDGSFVTSKPDPNDIDLILVLKSRLDLSIELHPMDYNVLSRKRVHKRFGFDMFADVESSERYENLLEFFQKVKGGGGSTKGILRIVL